MKTSFILSFLLLSFDICTNRDSCDFKVLKEGNFSHGSFSYNKIQALNELENLFNSVNRGTKRQREEENRKISDDFAEMSTISFICFPFHMS